MRLFILPCDFQNPSQALFYIPFLEKLGATVHTDMSHFTGRWFLHHRQSGDVVHLHWTHPFFIVSGKWHMSLYRALRFLFKVAFLRILGVRVIWTMHNLANHERDYVLLDRAVSTVLSRLAQRVIVPCQLARHEAQRWCCLRTEKKLVVIPLGSFSPWYPKTISRAQARECLGLPERAPIFLYFGGIRQYKGVPDLIRAFRQGSLDSAHLLVVGRSADPALEQEIESLADGDPTIRVCLGFVPEDEVPLYFGACNVVVLPFRDVLMSSSAILAMSFGRPVIAPALGCLSELLGDGRGILYDSHDANGLRRALEATAAADLEAMGQRCMAFMSGLTWEGIAQMLMSVYEGSR